MKYLLMSSNTSLQSDFFRSNQKLNGSSTSAFKSLSTAAPVNPLHKNHSDESSGSLSDLSTSLTSIPKNLVDGKSPKQTPLNRSRSEGSPYENSRNHLKPNKSLGRKESSPINEQSNSDNDDCDLNKSLPIKLSSSTKDSANDQSDLTKTNSMGEFETSNQLNIENLEAVNQSSNS